MTEKEWWGWWDGDRKATAKDWWGNTYETGQTLSEANRGRALDSNKLLQEFGNTVKASVFVGLLDQASDNIASLDHAAILGQTGNPISWVLGGVASARASVLRLGIPENARERFDALVKARREFNYGVASLFSAEDRAAKDENGGARLQVTSPFGIRPNPFTGGSEFHTATDVGGPVGTDIFATWGGRVRTGSQAGGAGNFVGIDLGFQFEDYFYDTGLEVIYMHLQSTAPNLGGTHIKAGTFLGDMGSTGNSNGSHMHAELRMTRQDYDNRPFFERRTRPFLRRFGLSDRPEHRPLQRAIVYWDARGHLR